MNCTFLSLISLYLIAHKRGSLIESFGTSEVSQLDNSFIGKHDISAFDILMDDLMLMQVVKGCD